MKDIQQKKAQAIRQQIIGFFLMISFPVVMMVAEMLELPLNWGLVLILFIVGPGYALYQMGNDLLAEAKELEQKQEERQHERETG